MKILNLYSGIGGNRKGWKLSEDDKVIAIEFDEATAKIYKNNFPEDEVIVADAHEYLEKHFKEFDFIWASPPCVSHSKMKKQFRYKKKADGSIYENNVPCYPDMRLYQEIIFLENFYDGYYCIENVIPYYEPLIQGVKIGRHIFWSNLSLEKIKVKPRGNFSDARKLAEFMGFDYNNIIGVNKLRTLRNCLEPEISEYIFNCLKEAKKIL